MWSRKPRTEHQNGEKVILETLNLAWLVPDKLVWLFKKLIICRDFPTWPSLGFTDNDETKKNPVSSSSLGKCLVVARHQRRMARLLLADSDTTMTQIITYDNQGKQKTISECSRRPHWVQECCHLRTENWGCSLYQLTNIGQQKIRNTLPGLQSLDFCCAIRMVGSGLSCFESKVADGVMVWRIISWHTLGPLELTEHRSTTTADLCIVADHFHSFMTTGYPSSNGHMSCHKAQIILDWLLQHAS